MAMAGPNSSVVLNSSVIEPTHRIEGRYLSDHAVVLISKQLIVSASAGILVIPTTHTARMAARAGRYLHSSEVHQLCCVRALGLRALAFSLDGAELYVGYSSYPHHNSSQNPQTRRQSATRMSGVEIYAFDMHTLQVTGTKCSLRDETLAAGELQGLGISVNGNVLLIPTVPPSSTSITTHSSPDVQCSSSSSEM